MWVLDGHIISIIYDHVSADIMSNKPCVGERLRYTDFISSVATILPLCRELEQTLGVKIDTIEPAPDQVLYCCVNCIRVLHLFPLPTLISS